MSRFGSRLRLFMSLGHYESERIQSLEMVLLKPIDVESGGKV